MEALRSSSDLQNFILGKVEKMKKNKEKERCVRLSFGVAMAGDEFLDIAEIKSEDEDNRFLQMEMNEPRLKQTCQEMSQATKLNPHTIKDFLLNAYNLQKKQFDCDNTQNK